MKNKKIVLLSIVLLVVGFIATKIFYQQNIDENDEKLSAQNKGAPFIRDHSPSFGKNKNKVTIVEFLDPECEACRYFHPAIKDVFNEYEEETKLVIRYLDNHRNSKFSIRLLEAAKIQNKYMETLEIILKYQPQWTNKNNPKPEFLWSVLPEAGLDMKKFKTDFDNNSINKMLKLDREDARQLGVTGTPTFYVNGKKLKKLNYKSLLDLVESEIYK